MMDRSHCNIKKEEARNIDPRPASSATRRLRDDDADIKLPSLHARTGVERLVTLDVAKSPCEVVVGWPKHRGRTRTHTASGWHGLPLQASNGRVVNQRAGLDRAGAGIISKEADALILHRGSSINRLVAAGQPIDRSLCFLGRTILILDSA